MQDSSNHQNLIKETNEASLAYYSDPANVARKYISMYAALSRSGEYFRNKNCLTEVFNMLDIVARKRLEEFQDQSERLADRWIRNRRNVVYRYQGRELCYLEPKGFKNRIVALRKYGCSISGNIDNVVRLTRNLTTHGNATVVHDFRPLDYEYTRELMLVMADALIELGMLEYKNRVPSFSQMRVRPGSTLQRGKYTVGTILEEKETARIYEGTQEHLDKRLEIEELKPYCFEDSLEENEEIDPLRYSSRRAEEILDTFFENGTFYLVSGYQERTSGNPRRESATGKQYREPASGNQHRQTASGMESAGSGFDLEREIRAAAQRLHLSRKGVGSFRERILREFTRVTGRTVTAAENLTVEDEQILRNCIRKKYSEYVRFARQHHIPVEDLPGV